MLGFCGHASKLGCSKCTKSFVYDEIAGKMNFGGFNECTLRNEHDHRQQAFLASEQKTPTARERIELKYGSRYSSLMELAYFDTVRFHIIDPMHNLFLGTAKYFTKNILLNPTAPLISHHSNSIIQQRVDKCVVPSTLGRIPHKIASGYASFTADQWKTWTNVFSLFSLHELLESDHFECWRLFVHASLLLTTPMITIDDAKKGHELLLEFCSRFESLFGSDKVTPNMHLHTHLISCIEDYGPIYSFWLFSFERYNGLLGAYRTNQRSVELQIMRKFTSDIQIHDTCLPSELTNRDLEFIQPRSSAGTLSEISTNNSRKYLKVVEASNQLAFPPDLWSYIDIYQPGGVASIEMLDEPELSLLAQCYSIMYPSASYTGNEIATTIYKYSQLQVGSEIYGSQNSRTKRSSYILACWCGRNGEINTNCLRPASVSFYFKHSVKVLGSFVPHYFAFVSWFEEHPARNIVGDPVTVWSKLPEQLGPASFLPVQRIHSKFVAGEGEIAGENVLFVMPLQQKVFI